MEPALLPGVISSYVSSAVGLGSQDTQPPYSIEWLHRVSLSLCARPPFGLNWGSSLASSEAMLICTLVFQTWQLRPPPYAGGVVRTVGWMLQHSPRRKTDPSKQGSGWALPGVWVAVASQEWPQWQPFLVGVSRHGQRWAISCPGCVWVNVARCPSPASPGAMWAWIFQFTKINTYLSANRAMQRNTGLKKQKMWTREWISFLLKNLLAKMPLFVILQVLTLKWIKKLLLTGVAECSALARVSILSCFLFSFPFVLLGWCLLCHFWKT